MGALNLVFRILLAVWVVGFVLISCVPLLAGSGGAGILGLLAGAVLLVPWLVGVLILAVLVWLTSPRGGRG
ncbi:MAG TPA: hypothetical protein VFV53_07490 [Candidatus Limnocylindrales bacterium]|nr:hypothetical protein [Candidatus Limnocylindrales bacterium]